MSIETEVKVVLVDVGEFQRRLDLLNRAVSSARHFEDSYYSLYVRYCRDRGESVTNMTFPPGPSD